MHRPPPVTRRRLTIATFLTAALTGIGLLVGSPASAAPPISAHLADPSSYTGIVRAWPGDKDKDPTNATREIDGDTCWSTSDVPFNRYIYVDVDSAAVPAGARRATVTVTYHDDAATGMRIAYDAQSNAWQTTATQPLLGSGSVVSSQFELTDIRFANRSNGADFRIDITANEGSVPSICVSDVTVSFADVPPLTITSPSLLFPQGDAHITLRSGAASVDYEIGDAEGVALTSGTAAVVAGVASLDVSHLGPGYYTLNVSADPGVPVTRTTSFGIVTPAPAGILNPDSFYGVGMHFGWQDVATEDALLESMALVGWGSTRSDAYWSSVEKAPGVFSFDGYVGTRGARKAASLGITTTFNWGLTNPLYDGGKAPSTADGIAAYGRYAAAASQYYADLGSSFSVWNEYNSTGFNNGACGITAECYMQLLSPTFDSVKAVAPDTTIMGPTAAGLSLPFAQRFLELGGLDKLDVYSTNAYGYHEPGQTPERDSFGTDLPTLVNMVDTAAGTRDVPFWLTETGTATNTAGVTEQQQAERIVRAQVLAMAAGVDKLLIYDALDDGTDPAEREHRFGQFRRPEAGITAISPKPAAVATAVLIREFPEAEVSERLDVGDADVYAYGAAAEPNTHILWSLAPRTVAVAANAPLTLTDTYGTVTTLTPHDGTVWIDLDESPVYLHGAASSIASATAPASLTVPQTTVVNGTVTATVSNVSAPTSTVTIGEVQAELAADGEQTQLTLPAVSRAGARVITGFLSTADGTYARLLAATTVIEGSAIAGRPHVELTEDGVQTSIDILITNNDPIEALGIDELSWRAGGTSGVAGDAPLSVAPSSTERVRIPVADVPVNTLVSYTVSARTANGEVTNTGQLSWSPVSTSDQERSEISLDTQGTWVALRGGSRDGVADLGGTLGLTATTDALHVSAHVTDDVHVGNRTNAADGWQVDSLQVSGYTEFPGVVGAVRTEFTAALLDGGPALYTHAAAPGQSPGATPDSTVDIARDDNAGTTDYAISVPWTALGFDKQPDGVFGLSLLVNDADAVASGDVRSGFIEWGGGVGTAPKDPLKFMSVQVVSPPAAEVPCDTIVDRDVHGGLRLGTGVTCVNGATVNGAVVVSPGASLRTDGATITGSLSATGADEITVLDSIVRGTANLSNTSGAVSIQTSTLRGLVSVTATAGGVILSGNEFFGMLTCTDNTSAPTGGSNTVHGRAAGQCASL